MLLISKALLLFQVRGKGFHLQKPEFLARLSPDRFPPAGRGRGGLRGLARLHPRVLSPPTHTHAGVPALAWSPCRPWGAERSLPLSRIPSHLAPSRQRWGLLYFRARVLQGLLDAVTPCVLFSGGSSPCEAVGFSVGEAVAAFRSPAWQLRGHTHFRARTGRCCLQFCEATVPAGTAALTGSCPPTSFAAVWGHAV